MVTHHAKEEGEITDFQNIREHTGLKMYTYTDLAKDVTTRRLVTSVLHEYNEVEFVWKIIKQAGVVLYTQMVRKIEHFLQEQKELKYLGDFSNHLDKQSKIQRHHTKIIIRPSIKFKHIN